MARIKQDPAIEAAQLARRAEDTFLALALHDVKDEFAAEFIEAEMRWKAADEAFADVVPSTRAGTLLKLQALLELLRAGGACDDSLEVRHVRALSRYVSASAAPTRTAGAFLSPA